MTDLRKAAEQALEALDCIYSPLHVREINKVGAAMAALRQALAESANSTTDFVEPKALAQPEQEFVGACVTCGAPKSEWLVDAVNMSQERVDETAKGEHEPVGFFSINDYGNWEENENGYGEPLYTAPPKREWVGLTDTQVEGIANYHGIDGLYETSCIDFYRAIEITLKEKNHG